VGLPKPALSAACVFLQDFAVLRAMCDATEVPPVIGDICEAAAWSKLQERWRL
jgi:hypothetical protein